mmetsp:Transcript_7526/g.11376  ORF Transcript_7526/g.11376 Transcript_7526/m.11376 type:complete len:430 (-) Transcript_7526:278-1567(-)
MKFCSQAFVALLLTSGSVDGASSVRQGNRKVEADSIAESLRYLQEQEEQEQDEPSLIESQFGPNPYANHDDPFQLVLQGEFSLLNVFVPPLTLSEPRADFCNFSFQSQKLDPSQTPFYVDLIGQSQHCLEHGFSVPFEKAAEECRAYDSKPSSKTHSMTPKGFIFHEPKAGASLLSNAIAVASPDTTRVISHSQAISNVLDACGNNNNPECDREHQIQLLKDVVYLLGRTRDPQETQMYITLDPKATVHLDLWKQAFPEVPWMFVYRDPDTILQKVMNTHEKRMCLKNRRNPTKGLEEFVRTQSVTLQELEDEEVCSALVGTYLQKAVEQYEKESAAPSEQQVARLVNYDEELLTKEGLHNVLQFLNIHVDQDEEAQTRIEIQRQKKSNAGSEWKGESSSSNTIRQSVIQANKKYVHVLHAKATESQQT